jgi:hypothetical protein
MEAFRKARTTKRCERNLYVHIKEMHTHMRETELKKEEELKQCEKKILKKWEKELRISEEQLEKRKKRVT